MSNIITVTKNDLYFGGFGLEEGIYSRVGARIAKRNELNAQMGLPPIGVQKERNILIGEIGEVAVRKDIMNRGQTIIDDSWSQFRKNNGFENVIDLSAHDGVRTINYQVKSSESGNRSIRFEVLKKCINSPLQFLVFVAIRPLVGSDGSRTFHCELTSQMMPRHIPQLATWKKTEVGYSHVDNKEFIRAWVDKTERYHWKSVKP